MFTLWYAVLTYREYKDTIWEMFSKKKQTPSPTKETAVVCPLLPMNPESPKSPVVASPPKPPRSPLSDLSNSSIPDYPLTPQATSTPINRSPNVSQPLEPPAKVPRSASPHPIKTEPVDDIEYEDDEEEEEEGSDVEEDEEDSVIASSPRRAQMANTVNEFINQEINQPNSLRLNQTR